MDRFVDEQQYHGGWCAWVWDSVPPSMRNSFNTADAGCITACLAILAPHVDAARAERYLAAHRRYLEQFVPRHDLGSGGFSNGWYEGMFHTSPYSVAAATQAVSFAAFHQATGEPAFLRRAERAVESMVAEWREDGRALFRPHDANNPRLLVATQFHDLYYMLEGMLWVFHNTNDEGLRDRIRVVWMNYLWGDRGLFAEVGEGDCWMEVARGPSAPKSRGILGVLCGIREAIGPASGLDRVIENGLRALCPGADQGAGDASGAPAAGDVGTPGIADAAGSTGGAGSEPTGSADERGPAKAKAAVGRPGLETIDHAFAALSLAEYLAPAANVMGAGAPPR